MAGSSLKDQPKIEPRISQDQLTLTTPNFPEAYPDQAIRVWATFLAGIIVLIVYYPDDSHPPRLSCII